MHIYLHAFIYESSHYVQNNFVHIADIIIFFRNLIVTLVKYFSRAKADQSLGLIGWSPFSQTGYLAWVSNLQLQLELKQWK